jgi:hypothetical protein
VSCLTSSVVRLIQIVTNYFIAQTIYFLNDYRLTLHAAHRMLVVDAPNETSRNGQGERWVLREPAELKEPNSEHIEQLESEMETEMPADSLSEVEAEIRKEENRGRQSSKESSIWLKKSLESTCLYPNPGPSSMFGILQENQHYSIGHGVLNEHAESPTLSDLENDDPECCSGLPPLPELSSPESPASDDVSSGTQMAKLSTMIPEALSVSSTTDGRLISELDSRTITAQALLDLRSNPRLNLLAPQPPVESYPRFEQQSLPSIASSPRPSTHGQAMDIEEQIAPVSEGKYMHMKDVRVALADVGTGTFTAAQRTFVLNTISAEPFLGDGGNAKEKEDLFPQLHKDTLIRNEHNMVVTELVELGNSTAIGESVHVQSIMAGPLAIDLQKQLETENLEIEHSSEDMEDEAIDVEDDKAIVADIEPDVSKRGGKYPSIRPIIAESSTVLSQSQMNMEDSEIDIYGAEDSENSIATSQNSIATMADVEGEVSKTTEPIVTGPTATLTQITLEAQYLGQSFPRMSVEDNMIATMQDDAASAIMEDFEFDASFPEAEIAESLSPEPSSPAEEPEEPSIPSQNPIDVEMSSLTSQSSMLESVVMADDVSDQMAIDRGGGGIDNAVEIAARAATVGAWYEALDGGWVGEDEDESLENWGS